MCVTVTLKKHTLWSAGELREASWFCVFRGERRVSIDEEERALQQVGELVAGCTTEGGEACGKGGGGGPSVGECLGQECPHSQGRDFLKDDGTAGVDG